ncbi:MAG: HAD hydrolase-like protein [Acidobacteriaceae bacterium]|nr:HAD hydrolase-like protein [Acidobacteriaceae bacterium]
MAAHLRLLVFDLDGTLIDSSLDLCNSINATLASVGKPALPNATIASYIGDGAAMLVRRALGDPGDADSSDPAADKYFRDAFSFFLRYYRQHKLDNTYVYPGVLDSLQAIRSNHPEILMAVLTNKPVGPSRAICDALGLSPFFFQNYGGDSFPTKKPDPTGLLAILNEASQLTGQPIPATDLVMVGDSDVDVLTARNIGARSLGCSYGLAPHALAAAEPDLTVDSATDWPLILGL